MFKIKFLSFIGLIICLLGLIACNSSQAEEVYIVPHSINTKSYDGDASATLYFVSNKEIPVISDVGISYEYDLNSTMEDYQFTEFSKREKYKEYYIYNFSVKLSNLEGAINIYEIFFKSESGIQYRFNTNVYVSSETQKANHIYGVIIDEDMGVPLSYYAYKDGIEMSLKPKNEILIKDIHFEGESSMNLTDYMQSVQINDEPLNEDRFIDSGEVFTLEIAFSGLEEWDGYIIDILVASYMSEDETLATAYIMVPLHFGHPVSSSRALIDSTWGQS